MRRELMRLSSNKDIASGILGNNLVLSAYMVISPVIMCGDSLKKALAMAFAFSLITLISVSITSFLPKKMPYGLRLMLHGIAGAAAYIPTALLAQELFPATAAQIGIFFPLAAVNSVIIFHSAARYHHLSKGKMLLDLLLATAGTDAVLILSGIIREVIGFGTIFGRIVDMKLIVSGISKPFGGMILLGIMCGIYRRICSYTRKEDRDTGGEANETIK